ncbi:MAG: amino acid adenylation domain-containing protein [Blastocatellia bacterium]
MIRAAAEGGRLSPQQEHLWSLLRTNFDSPYISQITILIEGTLDADILAAAIRKLVSHNEILRTTFYDTENGGASARVIKEDEIVIDAKYDIRNLDEAGKSQSPETLIRESARQGFDLEQSPPLRISLVALEGDKHILILTLSSLCTDATGLRNLMRKLADSYEAGMQGTGLQDEVFQYTDVSNWLWSLQEAEENEAGRAYWLKNELCAITAMKMPFEHAQVGQGDFCPESLSWSMDAQLSERVRTLAEQCDVPVWSVMLACWQILLWHLIDQPQSVIGVCSDGRSYEGLEDALGLFAKYLPLKCELTDEQRFSEIVRNTYREVAELKEWEEYFNWDKLPRLPAQAGAEGFLPFSFDFRKPTDVIKTTTVTFSIDKIHSCFDRFKLNLTCLDEPDQIAGEFHYDASYYSESEIRRLRSRFCALIESAARGPQEYIGKLDFFDKTERHMLLFELNDTAHISLNSGFISQHIEELAERTPSAVAVVSEGKHLTFADLNQRANKLAHHLSDLGARPGMLIGICLERALDTAVGILGILKAGAAFMPMDPTYPKGRLDFMLKDAKVSILLTHSQLETGLPDHSAHVFLMDSDWHLTAGQSDTNPPFINHSGLAYVIYTSGSTGKPRGVMITHENLKHYVQAMQALVELGDDDRYLHTASFGFSSAVRQLLLPLSKGASVVISTSEQRLDPQALFDLIRREQITVVDLVPSHWRAGINMLRLLGEDRRERLLGNSLRLIVSASEPLMSDLPAAWNHEFKHPAKLMNMFGQTETTGIVAGYPICAEFTEQVQCVPIGKPIADTRIYLLNRDFNAVAIGARGELCIAGKGIGDGYLNRPDLTADRFIPDAFGLLAGGRVYKTGDMGRYLADGNIEFLGRIDNQVKIRGFRVEPGEVEASLASHPAIKECVLIARSDGASGNSLVAYLVAARYPPPTIDELESFLRERLADYMVPTSFIILDSLPLTPNGKLDRVALVTMDQTKLRSEQDYVAPRTLVEEKLAGVWAQVLGIERVSVMGNFFRLGGHSLLATVLVSRLRDTFHIELPVMSLFQSPTVAGLAQEIERTLIGQADSEDFADALQEIADLSDEEIEKLLASEGEQSA